MPEIQPSRRALCFWASIPSPLWDSVCPAQDPSPCEWSRSICLASRAEKRVDPSQRSLKTAFIRPIWKRQRVKFQILSGRCSTWVNSWTTFVCLFCHTDIAGKVKARIHTSKHISVQVKITDFMLVLHQRKSSTECTTCLGLKVKPWGEFFFFQRKQTGKLMPRLMSFSLQQRKKVNLKQGTYPLIKQLKLRYVLSEIFVMCWAGTFYTSFICPFIQPINGHL